MNFLPVHIDGLCAMHIHDLTCTAVSEVSKFCMRHMSVECGSRDAIQDKLKGVVCVQMKFHHVRLLIEGALMVD